MRCKFLAKGHNQSFSLECAICAVFGDASKLLQPWKDRLLLHGTAPQTSCCRVEPSISHLVSDAGPGLLQCETRAAQRPDPRVPRRCSSLDAVAPFFEMVMSAQDPRQGGLGVECEKTKRVGRSRRFRSLEEVSFCGAWQSPAALERPRACAAFGL